jgi:hypothetical protein
MKFIQVIDNIYIQSIHVIDNIDNNLWWMKLCVYGFVGTNAIQAAKSITCIKYNMNFIYFLNEANHRVKWTHYN